MLTKEKVAGYLGKKRMKKIESIEISVSGKQVTLDIVTARPWVYDNDETAWISWEGETVTENISYLKVWLDKCQVRPHRWDYLEGYE